MCRHFFLTCVAIGAIFIQHAGAGETTKDASKEISSLRPNVTAIEVYAVPINVAFRLALQETDVVRMGCHYSAVTPADISSLVGVLADAQFAERSPAPYEIRTVIYLRTRSGEQVALTLSPEYINGPVRGEEAEKAVIAKTGFGSSLTRWQEQHQPLNPNSIMCQNFDFLRKQQ